METAKKQEVKAALRKLEATTVEYCGMCKQYGSGDTFNQSTATRYAEEEKAILQGLTSEEISEVYTEMNEEDYVEDIKYFSVQRDLMNLVSKTQTKYAQGLLDTVKRLREIRKGRDAIKTTHGITEEYLKEVEQALQQIPA